jgi:peptidyl-tRNA hydrolase, PTH1 family
MDRWLIAGLGNPGEKYAATRHNVGFMLIDGLAGRHRVSLSDKGDSSVGKGTIEGAEAILLKPLTYMNLSGTAVRKALVKFNLLRDGQICNLIVVHDDLDLPPGIVKIRREGSSGGHKGIESVINETGSREFIRIKIGIGRDSLIPAEDYVLRRFRPEERRLVEEGIIDALSAVETIITEGVEKAMNKYNRAVKPDDQG